MNASEHQLVLLPTPRRLERREGFVRVPVFGGGVPVRDQALREHIEACLGEATRLANLGEQAIECRVRGGLMPGLGDGWRSIGSQRYTLTISDQGIVIDADHAAGMRFAIFTLRQLLANAPHDGGRRRLACVHIEDEPSFPTRGVMLDVSRTRVPTMAHLFETVDRLASLKFNHLQLYTEHTFAYSFAEDVWRGCGPMTPDEIRRLDEHCARLGVELSANQNCFGHLHAWLNTPKFAPLAETHGDWMFDVWPRKGAHSICPTDPASDKFVASLLDELLPCFASPLVNVGCDETYDIGFGRSKDAVHSHGRAGVYLDFVSRIDAMVRARGRRAMFWGDIALSHPESIASVPPEIIALAWGYEPQSPFDLWGQTLREHGREAWVCPGTSTWRTITSRTTERRGNINNAARAGVHYGATGFLVCDWGDTGHHQQWPLTLNALGHAAQAAWDASSPDASTAARSLHALADHSGSLAAYIDELGDADLPLRETCGELSRPGKPSRLLNQTAIFIDMHKNLGEDTHVGDPRQWEATLERLLAMAARIPAGLSPLASDEMRHTLDVATFASERGSLRRRPGGMLPTDRARLTGRLHAIMDEHARLWRIRSREGGLPQSLAFYRQIMDRFEGNV
ncbi:MAG: family 20 glycosylhydrolase [Phycisphaerales bacterium]|nr:family 20 glycosylhydrolase [Phycisphaerales bacterium]